MPSTPSIIEILPFGSALEYVAYVPYEESSPHELLRLPQPLQRKAVLVGDEANADLTLLIIPSSNLQDEQALSNIRDWVDEGQSEPASQGMSLQHVQVFWTRNRIAVVAESDRLETVRKAIVEVTYYVSELEAIDQELGTLWPQLDEDTPLAFDYDNKAMLKRGELSQRFQQVYQLRSRLSRVTPFLLSPHKYPPTLASQVGERLRERVRVEERTEFVSDQLEVFEEIYELCGHRANEYHHARSNNTLEWLIIILLAAEVFIMVFDYLTVTGS